MFKNYLRVAVRNLIRHKGFTFINVFGLASSMSICLLIILFLIDQDRKDEYNSNSGSIYRVLTEHYSQEKDRVVVDATSPSQVEKLLSLNLESVVATTQLVKKVGHIRFDDKVFSFSGLHASSNFLEFFQWPLNSGDEATALNGQKNIIISETLASNLFGDEEPLGKVVSINGSESYYVSGIIDPDLYKTHLDFDVLLSSGSMVSMSSETDWNQDLGKFYNYVQLKEQSDIAILSSYLLSLESKFAGNDEAFYTLNVQRLDKINLGEAAQNEIGFTTPFFVPYFLIVLGLVVMLSASFNYMNLSVARALKRAKEVGVRKIIGAGKKQIAIQFLIESQIVMLVSMVIGIILLEMLVPAFNDLKILRDIDGEITLDYLSNSEIYLVFILFALSIGTVAGLYPAIYLASFKPISALKGVGKKGRSSSLWVRKGLLFIQYSFSVIFIITALILQKQSSIFINTNYGFDKTSVMNIAMPDVPIKSFRTELLNQSDIEGVSVMSVLPGLSNFQNIALKSNLDVESVTCASMSGDTYFIENLGLKLIAGRNFVTRINAFDEGSVIINRSAAKALGYNDPYEAVDKKLNFDRSSSTEPLLDVRIIGVLEDFQHEFVFKEIGPLVINNDPENFSIVNIRFHGDDHEKVAGTVENVWRSFDNSGPFEYNVYDAQIADLDDEFMDLVLMIGFVAFFAVIIASLGQFSMIVHHIELKIREIGIRKVLGSSVGSLMYLLSREFLVIIGFATICATPLAWKINVLWTSKMAVHPDVSWVNLSFGLIITFTLALTTIFALVRRAALSNPINSLQYEG